MQWHYVINFDTETNLWEHDVDTESVYFDNKTVWDTNTGEWLNQHRGNGTYLKDADRMDNMIAQAINSLNRERKEAYERLSN
jgi:hypothetical protein